MQGGVDLKTNNWYIPNVGLQIESANTSSNQ
jgi:hypothetical protein